MSGRYPETVAVAKERFEKFALSGPTYQTVNPKTKAKTLNVKTVTNELDRITGMPVGLMKPHISCDLVVTLP